MKLHITKEEKFIFILVIITIAFLLVRGAFLRHEEEQVEMSYEAGYASAVEDITNNLGVVETFEVDGDEHIILEINGEEHEYISPKALG